MSRRHKTYIFIVSVALVTLFVVGPPAGFASRLPTVCNIFSQKMAEKGKSCGSRAIFLRAQDKSLQVEAVPSLNMDFDAGKFFRIQTTPLSVSFPLADNPQFNPLRC